MKLHFDFFEQIGDTQWFKNKENMHFGNVDNFGNLSFLKIFNLRRPKRKSHACSAECLLATLTRIEIVFDRCY